MDATYRSDLKEMNESNFARFDAKMDARFSQYDARFAQFEAKMDARFAQYDVRFAQFEAKMDARFAQFEVKFAELHTEMQRGFAAQSRFMLLGWGTVLAAVVGFALK